MSLSVGQMKDLDDPDGSVWSRRFVWLCLAQFLVWTTIPIIIYPNISLDVAEMVAWGHEWNWGYFKHPPLVAWLAEIGRIVSGSGRPWAILLFAQLVNVGTMIVLWRICRRRLPAVLSFLAVFGFVLSVNFSQGIYVREFLNNNTLLLLFTALSVWFALEALFGGGIPLVVSARTFARFRHAFKVSDHHFGSCARGIHAS